MSERDNLQLGPADITSSVSSLKAGYTIGLNENDEFVFEIHGAGSGVVEMLGLHAYAGTRIQQLIDLNQKAGWPLVSQQLLSIQELLKVILASVARSTKQPTDQSTLPSSSPTK